jgi:hypothetical protein
MVEKTVEEKYNEKKAEAKKSTLTSSAMGLTKSGKTGLWTVVEIQYNLETGAVGDIKIVREDPSRSTAIEQFKISVAKTDILGG